MLAFMCNIAKTTVVASSENHDHAMVSPYVSSNSICCVISKLCFCIGPNSMAMLSCACPLIRHRVSAYMCFLCCVFLIALALSLAALVPMYLPRSVSHGLNLLSIQLSTCLSCRSAWQSDISLNPCSLCSFTPDVHLMCLDRGSKLVYIVYMLHLYIAP